MMTDKEYRLFRQLEKNGFILKDKDIREMMAYEYRMKNCTPTNYLNNKVKEEDMCNVSMNYTSVSGNCQSKEDNRFEIIVEALSNEFSKDRFEAAELLKKEKLAELEKNSDFQKLVEIKNAFAAKKKDLVALSYYEFRKYSRIEKELLELNKQAIALASKLDVTAWSTMNSLGNHAHDLMYDIKCTKTNVMDSELPRNYSRTDIKARLFLIENWEEMEFDTLYSKLKFTEAL